MLKFSLFCQDPILFGGGGLFNRNDQYTVTDVKVESVKRATNET